MNAFVGVKQVASADELKQLLENSSQQNYYFLQWPHKVSGIVEELSELPSPEGQMFNRKFELRWKQRDSEYEILILSVENPNSTLGTFEAIGNRWKTIDRNAHLYTKPETRFPHQFIYPKINIAQRYFMDAETATVHFVALTVIK